MLRTARFLFCSSLLSGGGVGWAHAKIRRWVYYAKANWDNARVVCVVSGLLGFASILQDSFGWDASDKVRLIFSSAG
jgi:hypothetical protein